MIKLNILGNEVIRKDDKWIGDRPEMIALLESLTTEYDEFVPTGSLPNPERSLCDWIIELLDLFEIKIIEDNSKPFPYVKDRIY